MSKILYIGNIPFSATAAELTKLVKPFGNVINARIGLDKKTYKSRGFGLVEVPDEAAQAIIAGLNGTQYQGRTLKVNVSEPHPTSELREKRRKRRDELDFDDLPEN